MLQRLRQRLAADQGGFTLIELLVVIIIIGILLAIAVPSYLSFKDRANEKAAASNVRAALPAVETRYADNGNYDGMTRATLATIDAGVSSTLVAFGSGADYCISDTVGNKTVKKDGPSSAIAVSATACTAA